MISFGNERESSRAVMKEGETLAEDMRDFYM